MEQQALMTIADFAKYMNISETVARDLLKNSEALRICVTVNKRVFILKEALDRYLNDCAMYNIPFGLPITDVNIDKYMYKIDNTVSQ